VPKGVVVRSLAVALLGFAAFARALLGQFVYDDRWTIVENRWLDRPLSELSSLLASGAALTRRVPDATRPLMPLGHWFERRVFGLAPWGYHLDSLLLYAACCVLALRVGWMVTRRRDVALVSACFFAVAPLHAEVVAAVNYREDLFATLGTLGALLCLCSPSPALFSGPAPASPRELRRRATCGAACLGLAALGKESAILFVPLVVVVAWCAPWCLEAARRRTPVLVAIGTVLGMWLVWRGSLALHGDDIPLAPRRPFFQLLLRTARFEVRGVGYALFPFSYLPDHWRQPDATMAWLVPCVSLVFAVIVLGRGRQTRVPALGVALALVAPLPCCPLVRPINEYADRYFFLGVLGGGLVWGWAAMHLARKLGKVRGEWLAVAVLPLAVLAFRAAGIWRSERTLWTAAAELTPASPRAWAALSRVHRLAGERDEADATVERALALAPDYVPAQVTQIYNELAFGRLSDARAHLDEMTRRGHGDGGGLGKARSCAQLDEAEAARCIAQ
jgi:hypothetical protein